MTNESSACSRRPHDDAEDHDPDFLSRIATIAVVALIIGIVISTLAPTPESQAVGAANRASRTSMPSTSSSRAERTTTSQAPTSSSKEATSSSTAASAQPTTSTRHQPTSTTKTKRRHHPNTTAATSPMVDGAATPTTMPMPNGGGSHAGGTFCNGWIRRAPAASHLTVYDTTGGRTPTSADCANARAFYNAAVAANAKFADINVALANHYKPGGDAPTNVARHYVYWGSRPGVADPTAPEGLVYRFDSAGNASLIGLYFYESAGTPLTQPGGPLTIWHSHTPTAARMLHVWTFPGTKDPFALMLSGA